MAVVNHAKREINAKIVYFGPPDCGKGDQFRFIHQRIKPSLCGPLKSMPAGQDALLFFEYIPFEHSSLDGYRIRFHLYTMTGPVSNPGTWKMTLKGVDGVALVTGGADSEDSLDSLRVLKTMLAGYGRDLHGLPRVWLTHDADVVSSAAPELAACFETDRTIPCVAGSGEGVLQGLAMLSQEVLQALRNEYGASSEMSSPSVQQPELPVSTEKDTEEPSQSTQSVTLPELRVSLSGTTAVTIPLTIQSGDTVKRCNLRFSLSLDEETP